MKSVQLFFIMILFSLITTTHAQQGQLDNELIEAIRNEDIDNVKRTLKEGANPNSSNKYGVTPLLFAAKLGDPGFVATLLIAGADPYFTHEDGGTPLGWAVWLGHKETVKAFLNAGIDPNSTDDIYGFSPLHSVSDPEVAILLLSVGASPNARDMDHDTPLHNAARVVGREIEIVCLLLEFGANIQSQNRNGETPSDYLAVTAIGANTLGRCPIQK